MFALSSVSRFRAAGIHLSLSILIGLLTLALMWFVWYPTPLFFGMGGNELALLIVGVDIALGPLATLVVFETKKKPRNYLLFDLAVIAMLQIAALAYGIHAMYQGRPVFTVFTGEHLAVVTTPEIDPDDLAKGQSEAFRTLSLTGPRLVAVEPPTDADASSMIAFAAFAGGGIQHFPQYYVPYADKRSEVLKAARPLADLELVPEDQPLLERYLRDSGRTIEQLRCLPVPTKKSQMTAIINGSTGDLLEILAIQPTLRQSSTADTQANFGQHPQRSVLSAS